MAALNRVDTALADCAAHIDAVKRCDPSIDTAAIEAYLARHVVVLMCAELETLLAEYVWERVDGSGADEEVMSLIKSVRGGVVRNVKHAEIASLMEKFSPQCRDAYTTHVASTVGDSGIARLGNAVRARDEASHSMPPNITLREVAEAATVAGVVLDGVRLALRLR